MESILLECRSKNVIDAAEAYVNMEIYSCMPGVCGSDANTAGYESVPILGAPRCRRIIRHRGARTT
ncbi:hypothetical protein SPHINGO8AM_80058 [Sphingomonas sp. 8AM]|nr:hypothetical protein SPHINGO8AM_80058 [Sphingomonas sp. 8AM]